MGVDPRQEERSFGESLAAQIRELRRQNDSLMHAVKDLAGSLVTIYEQQLNTMAVLNQILSKMEETKNEQRHEDSESGV